MIDRVKQWLRGLGWLRNGWSFVKDITAVLKPCRFSLIMLLFGAAFLVATPQGQDVLRVMAEGTVDGAMLSKWIWFFAALILWGLNGWYWARVMLRCRFDGDRRFTATHPDGTAQVRWLSRQIPRLLGSFAFFAVALAFARAAIGLDPSSESGVLTQLLIFMTICIALGIAFLGFVIYRGPVIMSVTKKMTSGRFAATAKQVHDTACVVFGNEHQEPILSLSDFKSGTLWALMAFIGISFAGSMLFTVNAQAAHYFGSAAIVLLAAGTWIPIGSMLVYFGSRYQLPVISFIIIAALAFSFFNDNHALRSLPGSARLSTAPRVDSHFADWLGERTSSWPHADKQPIYLVAAEGGGIRAAYWTGIVLAALQDIDSSFGKNLYAISGVSGGSLGGAVFTAILKEQATQQASGAVLTCTSINDTGAAEQRMQRCTEAVLQRDFLSPTVAALLFPDLTQRFLPVPFSRLSRAQALEVAWETGWTSEFGNDRFAASFHDLWRGPAADLPALFLNGTWVRTGKRIITSHLVIDNAFSDSTDFFAIHEQAIPLSTAVHNSARFTYVSPAGKIRQNGRQWGRIVDGGYFENSGATTAAEIFEVMMDNVPPEVEKRILPVFIMITNDPVQCSDVGLDAAGCLAPDPARFLTELLSPLTSILNTRTARGSYSRTAMRRLVQSYNGLFIELGLQGTKGPLPLGWVMSGTAHRAMQQTLNKRLCPLAGELSPASLARLANDNGDDC